MQCAWGSRFSWEQEIGASPQNAKKTFGIICIAFDTISYNLAIINLSLAFHHKHNLTPIGNVQGREDLVGEAGNRS